MASHRKSGAQAPGPSVPPAADLKPTKNEAPAVGAAQGFKSQDTKEQRDSLRDFNPEQALKTLHQGLRMVEQAMRKQYNQGRRCAMVYLKHMRSGELVPEDELASTVSSMQGYTLKIFCRFLERALHQGLMSEVAVTVLRSEIAPQQKRFGDLAVRFAQAGCALLSKKVDGYQTSYQVMCMGRLIETLPSLDAAERFLQLNTMGGSHAAD